MILTVLTACFDPEPTTETVPATTKNPAPTETPSPTVSPSATPTNAPVSERTAISHHRETAAPTPEEGKSIENFGPKALREPGASNGHHVLMLVPSLWLERGIWITNRDKAILSAGAPDPRTLEEYLQMDVQDQASFFEVFARMMSPDFVVALRQLPAEWKEELGLDLFSLSSTASVGATSGPPYGPTILMGEISDSAITQKLLGSGFKSQSYKGKEFHAAREDFGVELGEGLLGNSRTNRIFVDGQVMAASPDTGSMEEFLDLLVGEARPLTDNLLVLAIIESLGETFTAAVLTRSAVFNPADQAPLTYEKPAAWGTLSPWKFFAAGGGIEDGRPFFALSIAFEDPFAAESSIDEIKGRVENYQTIVPQRFPEAPHLREVWPNPPFDEVCNGISISSQRWTSGSTITVTCQTEVNLFWSQMVNMRDLGFLVQ